MAGELTIEQNTDGTATINFPGGGQHTVSGSFNVEALQSAYGSRIGKIVNSDRTAAEQKKWRDDTYGEAEAAAAEANKIAVLEAMQEATPVVNLTNEQLQTVLETNGISRFPVNHAANKIAIKNAILGLSMGLSFDDAIDMTSGGAYYTMLREGYADPNWVETNGKIPRVDQLQTFGGKLKYLQSKLTELTFGVVGSNSDTRDWVAAVTSGDALKGLAVATSQMYGGVSVAYQSGGEDDQGNPLPPSTYLVGGNGQVLRQLGFNTIDMYQNLTTFGVKDLSWADSIIEAQGNISGDLTLSADKRRKQNLIDSLNFLKDRYNPWQGAENLFNVPLATVYTPTTTTLGETAVETTTGEDQTTDTATVLQNTQQQEQDTDSVSTAANQAIQTQQDLPQTVSYQMPQGYQGSGFMPTYMNQTGMGMTTPTMTPMTGTFTKPAGTGMLSTQPSQTYTMGQTTTPTQQPSSQQQYEVRMYRNNAGMTTSITFVNGKPQTPIPSGFYPVDAQPAGQTPFQPQISQPQVPQVQAPTTQAMQQPQAPQVNVPQAPTVQPVTGYTPQFNMNQGGIVPPVPTPSGNKFGGFKPEALQRIAQNLGYSGDMGGFDQYLNDNPDKKQKMDNYTTRARQMAEGGMVPKETTIAGQPHRLAYVNPQEEKLLKAAGGAGVPSYGGIPAYFSIGPASTAGAGATVTDPTTGTVYTSNGTTWTTDAGVDVGAGMGAGTTTNTTTANPVTTATTTATTTQPQSTSVSLGQYDPRVLNQQYIPQQPDYTGQDITQVQAALAKTPGLPTGATVVPTGTQLTAGQLVSPYSGQVAGSLALPTALAATEQAMMPMTGQAALMSPVEASGAIGATVDQTQAAQLQQVAGITAAQQEGTSVANVEAAQGTGILMDNPVQRQIQNGELISGAANAQTAAAFNEEIQAATATPTKQATVQGQLETLMAQFEGGETPAWAAGSMRNAMATLSARGLGASSLAGQAVIQAAMEAALPIAQMDAQTQSQFEQQNLSNRQQRAILAAQQRAQFLGQEFDQAFQARVANAAKVSDVANMNFTAEQQVALENSRIANTMNLTNLSNSQAMVMAEASALANMDMANLNNRQQAAVQNAQNFLQADLTNLSNQQQTELFKAQQRVQSLFTDQAALNAAQQFNATSQNQVDQFFASLQSNTAQFNASQANAQAQFNAGQVNVIERFNAEINNQRDQFNAQNRLIIDQSNAQWRREIATADTAAVNRANEINAQALLGYSQQAYNNLWNYYADNMEWAWTSAENERQRYMNLAITKMQGDTSMALAEAKADYESSAGFGNLIGKWTHDNV